MKVHQVFSGPFGVNAWVIESGDEAMIVDATTGLDFDTAVAPRIKALVDPARVKVLYLTHCHCDHVGGAAAIRRLTGCRVCMHEGEAEAVRAGDASATLGALLGIPQEACEVEGVRAGDAIEFGNASLKILEVPGHTPHHTVLHDAASGTLFGGDLVFPGGSFGRVDFPGGDPDALVESLRRVAALDLENLYPGHMEPIEGGARHAIRMSLEAAESML